MEHFSTFFKWKVLILYLLYVLVMCGLRFGVRLIYYFIQLLHKVPKSI